MKGGGVAGREIKYLSLNWLHQNDSCIKVGSDKSYFNVSLIVRDKVTRQCPCTDRNLSKRKEGHTTRFSLERLLSITSTNTTELKVQVWPSGKALGW